MAVTAIKVLSDGKRVSRAEIDLFFDDATIAGELVQRGALTQNLDGSVTISFTGIVASTKYVFAFTPKGLDLPSDERQQTSLVRLTLRVLRKFAVDARYRYPDADSLSTDPQHAQPSEFAL